MIKIISMLILSLVVSVGCWTPEEDEQVVQNNLVLPDVEEFVNYDFENEIIIEETEDARRWMSLHMRLNDNTKPQMPEVTFRNFGGGEVDLNSILMFLLTNKLGIDTFLYIITGRGEQPISYLIYPFPSPNINSYGYFFDPVLNKLVSDIADKWTVKSVLPYSELLWIIENYPEDLLKY